MATATILPNQLTFNTPVAITNSGGYLYTCAISGANLCRIDPNSGVVTGGLNLSYGGGGPYTISAYKNRLYITTGTITYYDISNNNYTNTNVPSYHRASCVLDNFLYYINNGLKRMNLDTHLVDASWGTSASDNYNSLVGYNGFLYAAIDSNQPVRKIPINNPNTYTSFHSISSFTTGGAIFGLAIYNNSLYISFQATSNNIRRYDLDDKNDSSIPYASFSFGNGGCGITVLNGYLYAVAYLSSNVYKVILPALPTIPSNISIDVVNTYAVNSGNVQVSINDSTNVSTNKVYYWYSTDGGVPSINSLVQNNGATNYRFYILFNNNGIYTLSVYARNTAGNSDITSTPVTVYTRPTAITNVSFLPSSSGNINVSITETTPSPYYYLNGVSYMYYLYITGANQSSNILAYSRGANLTSTPYTTNFTISNLSANSYRVYLIAQNTVGNTIANAFSANVSVYTIPSSNFSIDPNNTITVASGNLQVRITDLSNTSLNGIYYQYSVNNNVDASFANSFIKANVSPYTFFIPSFTDISNTIYVRASNPIGNSSPAANLQVIVYQTPRQPPQVSFTLVGSGNVQVSINESNPVPYYYLNNVSYSLYAYNTFGGTNLSGNTSLSIYNTPVGVLANTNSAYGNIVSYVNTGLTANTYTMYVVARNTVGNSTPFSANIVVYTTPSNPSIDNGNTKSFTSGNLTISINDTVNNNLNGVYYLYSLDGINYGNSNVFKGANTRTTFTVSNTGNAQVPLTAQSYTLYIASANSVGNTISTPTTAPVNVYTTPFSPTIDASNTQCTTSGNLTVFVNDTVNSLTNGIYYLYSTDGITYGNSGASKSGNTTIFTISNTGNSQIPLTAGAYTLRIVASNPIGNTISSPATAIESVYTTPFAPVIDTVNTRSITSGNLNVAFTDLSNNVNNLVEYTYFIYDVNAAPLFYL